MVSQEQLDAFLSDPTLAKAIEASRRVDDIFDLLQPNEPQHSSILQWLLDPREGHGQGEAIFKDFLTAAHIANAEAGGRQTLLSFWTPGKIAVTGFQSLIVIRERSMTGSRRRQDLFLVDPVHEFIIVVENKAGLRAGPDQLIAYREEAKQLIGRGKPFHGYSIAHVLLDRYQDESTFDMPELKKWAYLDYSWLEKAARRAEARMERGVEAGQHLVVSYCRRQAEYKSEAEEALDKDISQIARRHGAVVNALGKAIKRKHPTKSEQGIDSLESHIWLWAAQNRDLTERISDQKTLAYIEHDLKSLGDGYNPEVDFRGKQRLYIADEAWEPLMKQSDNYWPLSIRVRQINGPEVADGSEDVKPEYSVCLEFWAEYLADPSYAEHVKRTLSPLFREKEFTRYQDSRVRRLGLKKPISEEQIGERAIALYKEVHARLKLLVLELK